MVTEEEIRAIALALPSAYEDRHREVPAFRIEKRIFALLRADPPRLVVKLEREDQLNLMEGHPHAVTPARHYSHHGWTDVWRERVDTSLTATLLTLAWAHVAPRRLSKAWRAK